jgi:type II secretory pathway component PulM
MRLWTRWWNEISPRERVIILGGGAIFVVVMAWLFVVTPLRDRATATADLVPERERLLVRRMDMLARRGQIAAELEAANARIERLNARLLTAAAPAVAASELQKLVKDMAAEARTDIRSERILPPEERGDLLEIPVEIAVSAEIRQLVDLLARVEGAQKLLTVKDLRVRVVNVSQPKELLATLTVSGFILPPGKAKA